MTQLHDENEEAVADAVVRLRVVAGDSTERVTCRTGAAGRCTVSQSVRNRVGSFTVEVVGIDADAPYDATADHDPDGTPPGMLTVERP